MDSGLFLGDIGAVADKVAWAAAIVADFFSPSPPGRAGGSKEMDSAWNSCVVGFGGLVDKDNTRVFADSSVSPVMVADVKYIAIDVHSREDFFASVGYRGSKGCQR